MAKADLKGIGHYTLEKWGREQRNHYLSILDACFHQLASNPRKGKDCSEIRCGYRKFNAGSHIIFYRQTLSDTMLSGCLAAGSRPTGQIKWGIHHPDQKHACGLKLQLSI